VDIVFRYIGSICGLVGSRGARRTLEAYSRDGPGGGVWRSRPGSQSAAGFLELEMPQGPLVVVFHARPECKDMIQMRQEESRPGEREHLMHEFEWKKYFMKIIVYTKLIDMKNWNLLMVVILLLTPMVLFMQLALAKEGSIDLANESLINSSYKTGLISFVESAVAYARENGKDKALVEFSNKTGSFVRGDLYIYAYDFNGICLAHPFKPDWIGKNKLDVTDSNGVPSLRNTLNVAREGKGFTYFIFPNPAHGNRDEFKIAYAVKVDENWFLGSGIYISCS